MNKITTFPGMPPAAVNRIASRLLTKHSAREIADAIEILVDVLDGLGGDPDEEDTDLEDDFQLTSRALNIGGRAPGDITAEPDDTAYLEWHTMRGPQKKGHNLLAGHEDDE